MVVMNLLEICIFLFSVHGAPSFEKVEMVDGAMKYSKDGSFLDSDRILDPSTYAHFLNFQTQFDVPCLKGSIDCLRKKHNFAENLKELKKLKGNTTFEVGLTRFMTWSLRDKMNSLLNAAEFPPRNESISRAELAAVRNNVGNLDWRSTGAVGPIKDQGNCGSCWAFSSVGAVEIQSNYVNGRLNGNRRTYSEQWVLDCSQPNGCNGGYPYKAMNWIQGHGIPQDHNLPYKGVVQGCPNPSVEWPLSSWQDMTGRPSDMLNYIRSTGPVSACFYVCEDFYHYTGGVYSTNCSPSSNSYRGAHCVALIGYGTTNNVDYWLGRNQWGTGWGSGGYFMIRRGSNTCSIENYGMTAPKADKRT